MSKAGTTKKQEKDYRIVEYIRHPTASKWDEKTIKKTANDVAKFKPGTPHTPVGFAELHKQATPIPDPPTCDPDEVARKWAKFPYVIGASKGKETNYILIKRDCCYVHARPVLESELKQTFKVKNLKVKELK